MAKGEREEEEALLADLKARTGRDLAEWMAAITAQGFTDKNETIDWLRSQGIPFARASWLERIHNNGGKPIYADRPAKPERKAAIDPARTAAPEPPAKPQQPVAPADAAALEKLIAAAKGYRPLYQLLEAELRRAVPGLSLVPRSNYISLAAPREFAALAPSASELRLGLDLGERIFDAYLQKARLKGVGSAITHMIVLTDARQVNADLMELIKAANARVNG
jgi:hypothetical protein